MFISFFSAQFEYIPGKVIEKQDDKNVTNIFTPMICAGYCINNKDFICNSFDFCSNDLTCRLSRAHIGDGKAKVVNSQTCDHFSSKYCIYKQGCHIYLAIRWGLPLYRMTTNN